MKIQRLRQEKMAKQIQSILITAVMYSQLKKKSNNTKKLAWYIYFRLMLINRYIRFLK